MQRISCSMAALGVALGAVAACSHGDGVSRGRATSRAYQYVDGAGLRVTTTATSIEQEVGERVTVDGRFWSDYIVISPKSAGESPGGGGGEHDHSGGGTGPGTTDAVSGASALVGGDTAAEWRLEARLGVGMRGSFARLPVAGRVEVRASDENDYRAYAALASGQIELANRNATVGAFAGAGHDEITPLMAPPGQADEWPATHRRVFAGATVAQVLSPRLVASAGATATFQRGQLANPYRRAVVRTTLFPEVMPDARDRQVGWLAVAASFDRLTALHLRAGGYRDSWGTSALIPAVAVRRQLGDRGLATISYRYYHQQAADFYQAVYMDLLDIRSSDQRLGRIRDHSGRLELRWRLTGAADEPGAWGLSASYALARTHYLDAASTVYSHIGSLGIEVSY